MKQLLVLLLVAYLPLNAQNMTELDSVSYSLGILMGKNIKSQGIKDMNYEQLSQGFKDILSDSSLKIELQDANSLVNNYIQGLLSKEGKEFLLANAKREGVFATASGLQYEILTKGTDTLHPKATDKVNVHYHGTLIDGTVFDSSVERGKPTSFPLNQVIKGWTEGVQLMVPGDKFRFFIPFNLAYGPRGSAPKIPPYATLIFDIELLEIM